MCEDSGGSAHYLSASSLERAKPIILGPSARHGTGSLVGEEEVPSLGRGNEAGMYG